MLSVCALAWILILSLALRCMLGAGVSAGWLIVGIMFSAVALGVVILIKEFTEAITLSEHFDLNRGRAHAETPAGSTGWNSPDRAIAALRRSELGLGPGLAHANRRRQAKTSQSEPPVRGMTGHR